MTPDKSDKTGKNPIFPSWRSAVRNTILMVAVLVGGCATVPEAPSARTPLALLPDQSSAILIGTNLGGVLDNRVFVLSVNGSGVADPVSTASQPIRIPTGPTKLSVAQRAGGFYAHVDLKFKAEPNTSYRVAVAQDEDKPWYARQIYSAGGDTFFWVENYSTGEAVSERVKVFVDMPNRDRTILIFIPRRK